MFYYPIPEIERKSKVVYDCNKCKLDQKKTIKTPHFIPEVPKNYNGLVILGESPSMEDDHRKLPFVNQSASTVRSTALRSNINLAKEGAFLYSACCAAGKKGATPTQIKCCRSILKEQLEILKPKVIVCCGEKSFQTLFDLKNKIAVSKLRNRVIPNYEFNCIVFPVYNQNEVSSWYYDHAFKWDLERIFGLWKKKYHKRTEVNNLLKKRKILENITITQLQLMKEVKDMFNRLQYMKAFSLDYETTNTDPFDDWFEIVYMQFGNAQTAWVLHEDLWKDDSMAFAYIKNQMCNILQNPEILKVLQHFQFEDLASRYVFGIERIENKFDCLVATHLVPDERRGTCSLDFQNLVRFGIPPYNERIKKYIEKENKDDKQNRIREAPIEDMVIYGGLDIITTHSNYELLDGQMLDMYPKARWLYDNMLMPASDVFANMTQRGVPMGNAELDELNTLFENNLIEVTEEIKNIPTFQEYNLYLKEKGELPNNCDDSELIELRNNIKEQINKKPKKVARVKLKRRIKI